MWKNEKITELIRRPATAMVAVGVGIAALTACGVEIEENKPATVIEHVDYPANVSFIMAGKVLVPIITPERFGLELKQCDREGDPDADAGGCVTAEVDVSRETYEQYADGDTIVLTDN
jgi:hypothetical protein